MSEIHTEKHDAVLIKEGKLDNELLSACIHCGLCLPHCPTYLSTGREMESPRGRLYLLNLFSKGELEAEDGVAEHIESCLGCLGCQTACPSGVQYEAILNQARPYLKSARPKLLSNLLRFSFKHLLTNYSLLKAIGLILRLYQRLGLRRLFARFYPDLNISRSESGGQSGEKISILSRLALMESFLPDLPAHETLPQRSFRSRAGLGTVQLFSGCVMDVLYNDVNHAASDTLQMQGYEVEVPAQTCCGALAYHAGEIDIASDLARKNIDLMENSEGKIIVTSAGCGAMLKEYDHLLRSDRTYRDRALLFKERVADFTECIALNAMPDDYRSRAEAPSPSVAYHAACHLAHAQKIREEPGIVLERLSADVRYATLCDAAAHKTQPDLDRVSCPIKVEPLREAEHCCGSAGIYNVLHPDMSLSVLKRKVENILQSKADTVVTTNPGCLMQLAAGARLAGKSFKVRHLASYLKDAYLPASKRSK